MTLNKKDRRHSGRVTPLLNKGIKKELLIEEGLEPQDYWDDWKDYRDGFRGDKDRKMIRNENARWTKYFDVKRWNKKLKGLISRRRVRKLKIKFQNP
ncbi:MAG: hypothetical protein AABX11_02680 [Nanoarchaeota archaeon]